MNASLVSLHTSLIYEATHTVPDGGMPTWPTPDGSQPEGPRLDQWLDVQVVEARDAWARIQCENGWEAWVDGRRLRPIEFIEDVDHADDVPAAPPHDTTKEFLRALFRWRFWILGVLVAFWTVNDYNRDLAPFVLWGGLALVIVLAVRVARTR